LEFFLLSGFTSYITTKTEQGFFALFRLYMCC